MSDTSQRNNGRCLPYASFSSNEDLQPLYRLVIAAAMHAVHTYDRGRAPESVRSYEWCNLPELNDLQLRAFKAITGKQYIGCNVHPLIYLLNKFYYFEVVRGCKHVDDFLSGGSTAFWMSDLHTDRFYKLELGHRAPDPNSEQSHLCVEISSQGVIDIRYSYNRAAGVGIFMRACSTEVGDMVMEVSGLGPVHRNIIFMNMGLGGLQAIYDKKEEIRK